MWLNSQIANAQMHHAAPRAHGTSGRYRAIAPAMSAPPPGQTLTGKLLLNEAREKNNTALSGKSSDHCLIPPRSPEVKTLIAI